MVSGSVRTTEGPTTSFGLVQQLPADRMAGAREVNFEINFTVAGAEREARQARAVLMRELGRCTFTTSLQRFIDSHRDQINYVKIAGTRMDVDGALFELEDYLEPGVAPGGYRRPAAQAVPTPTEAVPQVVQPARIEEAPLPEIRSPLEYMRQQEEERAQEQEERARAQAQQPEQAQAEQVEPPPQLQEQEGVLLTQQEAAAVEAVPEAVQEQAAEQVRENVTVINAAVPLDAEYYQREYLAPEVSEGVRTYSRVSSPHLMVMGWWGELVESCERSEALAARLDAITSQYYGALDTLEGARGTPGERALQNKVRELEGQMRAIEREMDPMLGRQGQLMVNILANLPDAYGWAMSEPSRDRDAMLADLNAIRDEWASNQAKIRDALSLREISGDIAGAFAPAFAAARRGSIENMYDVFSRMMQNSPEIAQSFVDWVALGEAARASYAAIPVGEIGAAVPTLGEATTGGAFEFRSRRGTFRITIAGEDLSGMTFAEAKRRVTELVNDQSIGNQQLLGMLTVEQLREGKEPYRFMSRYLLRTQFFQDYASGNIRVLETAPLTRGGIPASVYEVAHAPPVVAERPLPVVPQVTAPPAEAAPAPAAVAYNYGWAEGIQEELRGIVSELVNLPRFRPEETQARHDELVARGAALYREFYSHVGEAEPSEDLNRIRRWMSSAERMSSFGLALNEGGALVEAVRPAPPEAAEAVPPAAPAAVPVPAAPVAVPPTAAPVTAPPGEIYVPSVPTAPAPAPSVPVLEGQPLAAFARRYGISTDDARDLNRFQLGQRNVLEVQANSEENANRLLNLVRMEANRRGVASEYDVMPPQEAGGPYIVYYRPMGMLRAADRAAVEAQNPFAFVGFATRLPMEYAFDFAGINTRFGQAFAPYEARLVGFADAATIAQNPDAQLPAYAADTVTGLASWVFHIGGERVSGLERAGQLIYARTPQQPVALTVGEAEALFLNQREAAAFAAAFFTGDAGRAYRDIEGRTLNIFESNIRAALAERDNAEVRDALGGALGRYATEAYTRLSRYYGNPALVEERISTLEPEARMSFEYAAEMLGEAMYRMRLVQTGEPESEDLRIACVNSARAILIVKIEGEGGRVAFDKFMHNGREYNVGTNSLFTSGNVQFALEDGTVLSNHLLYVPQPEPGVVLIVGYMKGNDRHMLADEGITPFIYDLNQQGHLRDSLGFAGLTERWTWHLPLIDIRVPEEGMLLGEDTPLFKAMDPLVMDLHTKPTEVSLYIEGNFDLVPADYGAGADIDDAKFIMENVRLGGELVPADRVFSYEGVWFEFNNFRRAGQNRYFATAAPEVTSTYAGMFEEPGEIQNVAEFAADGRVYAYMRNGKLVDAERQADSEGVMRVWIGTYRFTLDAEGERIMPDASTMAILPEYRSLIFARIGREELEAKIAEERAAVGEYRIEIDLNTQASSVAGERVIPYLYIHKGPIAPETEAGAGADLRVAEIYDAEGYLVPRAQRIDAIDARFLAIQDLRGTEITVESWNALKAEMDGLHEERVRLFTEMLGFTTDAMGRIEASGILLDEESRGRLQTQEAALRANISGMGNVWSAWEAARDRVDRQLGL
ncbi:MAG: hypothetical protein PHQ80_01180 [Candidatus ainarchaeum sp.]|nr:hypothetical protein [Candidatus ainarchaeum sp.]